MTHRQRNIPVTTKQQIEVQTDVKLIDSYLLDSQFQQRQPHSTVTLSQTYTRSGLLRPFTDNQLLRELGKNLQELKQSEENQGAFAKRLQILEGQIEGLLRRDVLIHGVAQGSQAWNSYYLTLNDKEKTIIQLENEKIYSDLKIQRLRSRIEELEREVDQSRKAVVATQKIGEENKLYASFYERLNTIINTSKRKGIDFEQLLNEQVVPMVADFSINLTNFTRSINRDVHASLRPTVSTLAREFDRLLKEQQFSEEKIGETISSLFVNFKAVGGVEHLKEQFDLANRAYLAQSNYKNLVSLFHHEISHLKQEHPRLKTLERLDVLLKKLDAEGVQIIDCKGWMNLVVPEIKVLEIGQGDVKLKELIVSLGAQFKKIYASFPELKAHVSSKIVAILESDVLRELIDGGSIERIQEIVVHQIDQVKVNNVYMYSSSKDNQLIFRLRVLVKVLLEELEKVKKLHGIEVSLDQGILGLLKEQMIQGVDIQAVIGLFRPPCKYVSVPVVVQKPVYRSNTYEKGVPINTETPILLEQTNTEIVVVNRQVPVYIERPIDGVVVNNVPVFIEAQKAVPVQVRQETVVERIVQNSTEVQVIREKSVPVYEREQVIKEVSVERIVEVTNLKQVEKVVQVPQIQYSEIEKIVEVPHYIYETRQIVKQVQVQVPFIVNQLKYVEVEKTVTQIVEKNQIVNIIQQVPVEIRVPEIRLVEMTEIRDKVIVTHEYNEKVKEIPVIQEKEIIREVPKEIFIERSHFIKGDKQEVIREVEVLVEKPFIHEILTTKNVQIEKVVPLYITQQVPVITEINVPMFSEKVRQLQVEKVKLVPVKEQIVRQVNVEKPVPVVVQKQVVRIEKQIVEKIIQKIVEVPRVVQVEKIVEKIVVVPRIVQKIVEVPKIIQRIVIVEQPILQIVEIPVPQIIIQVVQKIVQVIVERPIIQYVKEIEQVNVERIVERVIEREKAVEVEVQRRIPYEVVRQVPVPTYRDRIEIQRVQIHEVKVETIEVQVPLIVSEKVPFIQEKTIVTEHIIEKPILEKVFVERQKPIFNEVEKLVVKEIIIEKAVLNQIIKQIPIEKIVYQNVPQIVQTIRDRLVQVLTVKQTPKEIILQQQKIIHQIHEKIVEVPINQIVTTPQLIQVPTLVNLVHYKQIPVDVPVREERVKRDIIQHIKQVQITRQVPVGVQICREKIKEVVNQVQKYLTQEIIKEIRTEVQVPGKTEFQIVNVPTKTVTEILTNSQREVDIQQKIVERLVQKIVMLPQIVEVVRNIHHISEVNSLGVAVDVDVNIHTEKFIGVSNQLRIGLVELLKSFKSNVNRQPQLKNLIAIIEKYIVYIDDWMKFPKLIQIIKEVEKEVIRDRPVLVPTADKEKQVTLTFIIEKLVNQLRRIRDSHKITLGLEQDLLKIFFERKVEEGLSSKLIIIQQELKRKHSQFGQWAQSNPFLVNAFLQDHFALQALIEQSNREHELQQNEIALLRIKLENAVNQYNHLLCFNTKMFEDNSNLIRTLEKYRSSIDQDEFSMNISIHKKFYEEIIEEKHSFISETIKRTKIIQERYQGEGQQLNERRESNNFGQLVSKLSRYENRNQELEIKNRRLESEVSKLSQENVMKVNIIKRLEGDFEARISSFKQEFSKVPATNKQQLEENRKLVEKIRSLERQVITEKSAAEKARKELQKGNQGQKRDFEREAEKRERQVRNSTEQAKRDLDREISRLKVEVEKFRKDKERLQAQLVQTKKKNFEELKNAREGQMSSASERYSQLLKENVDLKRKIDGLEAEKDKQRKEYQETIIANERQIARLRLQIDRLISEKREIEKKKKEGFLDLPQETQIINRNIEVEKKLKVLETQLDKFKSKDQNSIVQIKSLREKIKKLEVELEIARKEVDASQKSRLQATTYQSGFKQTVSIVQNVEGSVVRSPRSPPYKVGNFASFQSPQNESSMSREERIQDLGSSSSRISQQSEDLSSSLPTYYSANMTLREFIDAKHNSEKERDMYVTMVMIKVIEQSEVQADSGIYNSYTPNNIFLSNFAPKYLDRLVVKFGNPVDIKVPEQAIYLSPQVLSGATPSRKSTVFTLGIILDELIHGAPYFQTSDDILNQMIEFKVRGESLNPILKNTLFEMMNKEPTKRLDLLEAKRRLSLQKYITTESRSTLTLTSRATRKP